ncbi:class I SAM-dependent methyltransferase [Undibacterium sp. Di27W]|uniref:class I SAM-dependent methyltransferase n=1 Tax=Undibacterium sp. Di27W TaxID=3413036 RepID=UPI003BF1C4B5
MTEQTEQMVVEQPRASEAIVNSEHQEAIPPQAAVSVQTPQPVEEALAVPSANGWKQKIRRIPGLGYALAWCNALWRLPRTRVQTEQALARLQWSIDGLQGKLVDLQQQLELQLHQQSLEQLHRHQALQQQQHLQEQRIAALEAPKLGMRLDQYDALDIGERLMQLDRLQIARQLRSVNLMMRNSLQVASASGSSSASANQGPDNGLVQAPATLAATVIPRPASSFDQDQFYLEFEALFRGSRADIKQRLQAYLPYLSHISEQAKDARKMVIDVGCGRGEWLELLDEQGIPAMGVDMNISMVNACLDQGFLVRHADAIAYLREQPAGSVGAVTGFQIIEHLPFEQLIALFDAAHHALCPGGVIIFETPNPENLKVGACNFYFDPTHLHPIVPQVAEFMARQRGFAHTEILRLHPYPDDHLLHGDTEVEALLNKELFGPQDYAVIGRK